MGQFPFLVRAACAIVGQWRNSLCQCWLRHSALYFGVLVLIGTWCAFTWAEFRWYAVIYAGSILCLFPYRRWIWSIAIIAIAGWSTHVRCMQPPSGIYIGCATLEVQNRSLVNYHGKSLWKVCATVHQFCDTEGHILAKGISVSVHNDELRGGIIYDVVARLSIAEDGRSSLKILQPPKMCKQRWSIIEWRVSIQRLLSERIAAVFSDSSIRSCVGALCFGLYKDPLFQHMMHRCGVEHVLAISGFHFGIVAALVAFFIQKLPSFWKGSLAMVVLTGYVLIVGPLPSVMRAWTSAMVILLGTMMRRNTSALNCLGAGLIVTILYNPESVLDQGFQLSFLATLALILFSSRWAFVHSKPIVMIMSFSIVDQILTGILSWFTPSLSMVAAVFSVLLPYQIAFMEDFSLLGAIYNIIVPLIFSIALPLAMLAIVSSWVIPWLSSCFAWCCTICIHMATALVMHVPEAHWAMIDGHIIMSWVGKFLIVGIIVAGLIMEGRSAQDRSDSWKACL